MVTREYENTLTYYNYDNKSLVGDKTPDMAKSKNFPNADKESSLSFSFNFSRHHGYYSYNLTKFKANWLI